MALDGGSPSTNLMIAGDAFAELQRTVADMKARLEKLEPSPAEWGALKVAAHDCGVEYETARTWAAAGLIEARQQGKGKRWFVNVISLRARAAMFTAGSKGS